MQATVTWKDKSKTKQKVLGEKKLEREPSETCGSRGMHGSLALAHSTWVMCTGRQKKKRKRKKRKRVFEKSLGWPELAHSASSSPMLTEMKTNLDFAQSRCFAVANVFVVDTRPERNTRVSGRYVLSTADKERGKLGSSLGNELCCRGRLGEMFSYFAVPQRNLRLWRFSPQKLCIEIGVSREP